MKTLYDLLGVRPDADNTTIRAAFRRAAKAYHPDVNAGDLTAEERFKEITAAHAVLRNPGRRANYDCALQRRRQELLREWKFMLGGCGLSAAVSAAVISASIVSEPKWFPKPSLVGSSFEVHLAAVQGKGGDEGVAPAASATAGKSKAEASPAPPPSGPRAGADRQKQHHPAPQDNMTSDSCQSCRQWSYEVRKAQRPVEFDHPANEISANRLHRLIWAQFNRLLIGAGYDPLPPTPK